MKKCSTCKETKPKEQFHNSIKYNGKHYSCKECRNKQNRETRAKNRNHYRKLDKIWRAKNPILDKLKQYRRVDKAKGFTDTLSKEEAIELMSRTCFYCNSEDNIGLDRENSNGSHSFKNVVPCCYKCNFILSDLPYLVKLEFVSVLRKVKEQNLLEYWQPPAIRYRNTTTTE